MPLPPLVLASALLAAAPAAGLDEAPETRARSLAFGGLETGDANLSLEVGWLRSGLRADLGVVEGLAFTARADAFLLHELLRGQNGGYLGLRYSLPADGPLRLAVGAEAGGYFVTRGATSDRVLVFRGEVAVGLAFDFGTPLLRGAVVGLRGGDFETSLWRTDGELGLGYELQLRRLLLGVEGFTWLRSPFRPLPQWRIRAGWAF